MVSDADHVESQSGLPGPPVHLHPTAEESYDVIEGALEVFMDGK